MSRYRHFHGRGKHSPRGPAELTSREKVREPPRWPSNFGIRRHGGEPCSVVKQPLCVNRYVVCDVYVRTKLQLFTPSRVMVNLSIIILFRAITASQYTNMQLHKSPEWILSTLPTMLTVARHEADSNQVRCGSPLVTHKCIITFCPFSVTSKRQKCN